MVNRFIILSALPLCIAFSMEARAEVKVEKISKEFNFKVKQEHGNNLCQCSERISYPKITGLNDKILDKVVKQVKKLSGQDNILTKEECKEMPCVSGEYNLNLDFDVKYKSGKLLSILFSEEHCCGAYPSGSSEGANFDLTTGSNFKFSEIVKGSNYDELIGYIDKQITNNMGEDSCKLNEPLGDGQSNDEIIKKLNFYLDKDKKSVVLAINENFWAHVCGSIDVEIPEKFISNSLVKEVYH